MTSSFGLSSFFRMTNETKQFSYFQFSLLAFEHVLITIKTMYQRNAATQVYGRTHILHVLNKYWTRLHFDLRAKWFVEGSQKLYILLKSICFSQQPSQCWLKYEAKLLSIGDQRPLRHGSYACVHRELRAEMITFT